MQIIPAIDVLDGRVVRLRQGDFDQVTPFESDPVDIALRNAAQGAMRLHLVNLGGAKKGIMEDSFPDIVRAIASRTTLELQVSGGIRSLEAAAKVFEAGADRIVLGTALFTDPELVRSLILLFGSSRILAALDTRDGVVRMRGWQESTNVAIDDALTAVSEFGIKEILLTDISCDGMEQGPNKELYQRLCKSFPYMTIIASGGVRNAADIRALSSIGCSGAIVGKALLSGEVRYRDLLKASASDLAIRIIPCLDVAGGRTVKGTRFQNLRDAGDPIELAQGYCEEGADELVFLDISATKEERQTVYDLAKRVAGAINIPFTIGGGVRSLEDAQQLFAAGADKVSVNSAAVKRPELLSEMAQYLGRANTVCAMDVRRRGDAWIVLTKGGTEETSRDALAWAEEATERGAGELLVTSFDRDGTGQGFDTELLRCIKERVNVPVIASGGAGTLQDFIDAADKGRSDALLAASVFHFGTFSIREVKQALQSSSFPVRL